MKFTIGLVIGLVAGIILTGLIGWSIMPGSMLKEYPSPYGVDETVDKIKSKALNSNWVVSGVKPLHESIKKHGGGNTRPVMLVNLCQPNHAFNILEQDENRKVSVFMPCTISVFQKSDGSTWIGAMNAGLMGRMFGGRVAEVMSMVSDEQQRFIEFATQ
jgi:uncharacterized protein (DUF302 family)